MLIAAGLALSAMPAAAQQQPSSGGGDPFQPAAEGEGAVATGDAGGLPGSLNRPPEFLRKYLKTRTQKVPAEAWDKATNFKTPLPQYDTKNWTTIKLQTIKPPPDCRLCLLIQELDVAAEEFTDKTIAALAPPMAGLFRVVFGTWIVWTGILYLVGRPPPLEQLGGRLVMACVIMAMLTWLDLWVTYVYVFVKEILLGIGLLIVNQISDVAVPSNAADFGMFAQLYGMIEASIMNVIVVTFKIMSQAIPEGGFWRVFTNKGALASVLNVIFGFIMLLPFAFVMLIFAAYMVEAIFKFLATTALSPVWIAAAFLGRSRSFMESAIRLYISGGLTIVFASLAMGFTLAVTHRFTEGLYDAVAEEGAVIIMSWGYWAMLVLGFISVLLHLKAATLASNISGSNDGAGPAAATVMAGKMAVGAGIVGAARAARGVGGDFGMGKLMGSQVGQAASQYGAAGALWQGGRQATGWAGGRVADLARRFASGMGRDPGS